MKPILIATALVLGMATAAHAGPGDQRGAHSEARAQKHLEHLSTTLNLTDAQQLQIKALMDEQRGTRQELFQRHKSERQAMRDAHKAELDQILSTEQKARMEELRAERRQQFEGKRHGRHGHGGKHGRRAGND